MNDKKEENERAICGMLIHTSSSESVGIPSLHHTNQPRPPFLATTVEDLYDYITTTTANCTNPLIVPGSERRPEEDATVSGHEGTYICMDGLPNTPDKCRIYSFAVNREDIKFESTLGQRGCRVHVVTSHTEYSYARLGTNVYLYPLELALTPGHGNYTLDNFINLLTHMWRPIHYVKTTTEGGELLLLRNLFTSTYEAYNTFKQIRLLLHLPLATDDNLGHLEELYRLLVGLEYYGYHLVYSRPIPGYTYNHYTFDRVIATKYETVWVKQ
ncbi:hypothetical protein Pmani_012441 [Petrolisthes manimaculis]|uniref:Uncharacterized protein n=1 Tax=Petrolisthes manimaculis TaxID=1843537 RepID=A0AAE1PYK9_9EUCA|nr:hypothetical protein Pmani_012441 [Petrolisthes manimaculis]